MSKTCSVEGCNNKHCAKGYCRKHYMQINRHGRLTPELENKPNVFEVKNNFVSITIHSKGERHIGYIDIEEYEIVKQYNWNINEDGYIVGYVNGKIIPLHRFITNCPNDKVVDHINRNKLDNRKSNLRICTIKENNRNHSKNCNNKSGYKNIYKVRNRELWKVSIKADDKDYVKYFKLSELDKAIMWRDEILKCVHGEYANLDD